MKVTESVAGALEYFHQRLPGLVEVNVYNVELAEAQEKMTLRKVVSSVSSGEAVMYSNSVVLQETELDIYSHLFECAETAETIFTTVFQNK